jgi:hypothetical protein
MDSATTAWIAAVVAAGGSVSSGRQTIVDDLIAGLKADGVWSKLDRLWLTATENTQSALIDLVATSTATPVNSPTFAANLGYTGSNASNKYIDSNLANNSGTGNYSLNEACLFGWSNTAGMDVGGLVGTGATYVTSGIFPEYTDTNSYSGIVAMGLR